MKKKPTLIVFYGIDGSGKSTQAISLFETLKNKGVNVEYIWSRRVPFFTKIPAQIIKKIMLKEVSTSNGTEYISIKKNRKSLFSNKFFRFIWVNISFLEYLLLTYYKVFWPNRKKEVIICDRYLQDAIVDFSVMGRMDVNKMINNFFCKLFPLPDQMYFIEITAEVGASRKKDGTSLEYLKDRVPVYKKIASFYHSIHIDGNMSQEVIQEIIYNNTKELLKTACL